MPARERWLPALPAAAKMRAPLREYSTVIAN
ncbi:hypothetical protein X734_24050 [Mesorhizobium sp. L2C084A000]|nr:hypothetical protein X734_24050 [Mesorhizobium sp. L2C084A000]